MKNQQLHFSMKRYCTVVLIATEMLEIQLKQGSSDLKERKESNIKKE